MAWRPPPPDGSGPDAEWVLDGEKRWIGNATFADLIIVWARDTDPDADGAVRGFVVPSPSDGMTITKIEGKQSLRIVQNADILLDQVRVPESHRLSGGSGTFRDAGLVLQRTGPTPPGVRSGCRWRPTSWRCPTPHSASSSAARSAGSS